MTFATFVKTASEVLDCSARQRDQAMTRKLSIAWEGRWYEVRLELVADEYEPHALLSAVDDAGETVAKHRVLMTVEPHGVQESHATAASPFTHP